MNGCTHQTTAKLFRLGLAALGGALLLGALLLVLSSSPTVVRAAPIPPSEGGYPKFNTSVKTVTPTLAHTGGVTLCYTIEIINTGAYTAANTTLTDFIPDGTTYNDDLQANVPFSHTVSDGTLTWVGDVGFDFTAVVRFSVSVSPTLVGTVHNTAVISHPLVARPITLTAETIVTDEPILTIEKTSVPSKPGDNKPMTYTIVVANWGQPTPPNMPITVTDWVPLSTTLRSMSNDGISDGEVVTWTRDVTLELGETTVFTFSVDVGDVPSGTVITNADYQVASPETGVTAGEPHTVTIVTPIFWLSKSVWPDPPGSNREMTYTLTLLNVGSLATGLVVTDRVPAGVEYRRGGSEVGGVVSWALPRLDTGEAADFTFTVYINDVMGIPIVNDYYRACCAEGVCVAGDVLTSVVGGPTFEVVVTLDPIAKKPGGGGGPVTPTLIVHNLGPGNALGAQATLFFNRISVSANDLYAIPPIGTPPPFPGGPDCGDQCVSYVWVGSLGYDESITFTTNVGQSTIGGEEGTRYTTTIVITDSLSNANTDPVTGTASGKITHYANLLPSKSAPPVIGRGQLMTYAINVWNSALATEEPPSPWLVEVVPMSTTLVSISDGGVSQTLTNATVISWTLPPMGPGAQLYRSFTVRVDSDLVSGTQIVNDDYRTYWYETEAGSVLSNTGQAVTTTVQEVGLIHSYKEVTPTVAAPGPNVVLTYYLHIVNSSPLSLTGVTVYDLLPWQFSTYQRDAVASAGQVVSDIVSIRWAGDVAALSSEVVTFTVLVDPDFQGAITNTALISHPDLLREVVVQAVAYITEKPVLEIRKRASPDPVERDAELAYTIRVVNLGQQATGLVITDVVPANTVYIPGSATAGGQLVGDQVHWEIPVLEPGESRTFEFRVTVQSGDEVINDQYAVECIEGVVTVGAPVVTDVAGGGVYLPLVMRRAP